MSTPAFFTDLVVESHKPKEIVLLEGKGSKGRKYVLLKVYFNPQCSIGGNYGDYRSPFSFARQLCSFLCTIDIIFILRIRSSILVPNDAEQHKGVVSY